MQPLALEEDGLHGGDGRRLLHVPHSIALGGEDAQRVVHAGNVDVAADARQAHRVRVQLNAQAAAAVAALDQVNVSVAAGKENAVLHVEQSTRLDEHWHTGQGGLQKNQKERENALINKDKEMVVVGRTVLRIV